MPMIFEVRKRRNESFASGRRRDVRCGRRRRRRRVWSWDRRLVGREREGTRVYKPDHQFYHSNHSS